MSTLRPARVYVPKDLEKKRKGADTEGKVDQWYPTEPSLKFLPKGRRSKKEIQAWYAETIKRAREDVNAFIEFVLDPDEDWKARGHDFVKQAWFHKELHELLNKSMLNRNDRRHRHVAIALPRGHGKTAQIVGRILWELGRNPNLTIRLVCNTPTTAEERIAEIKEHIESNGYLHAVFPNLVPDKSKKWGNQELFVERSIISKSPSVGGYGILGSNVGGRCSLLIGDDVVDPTTALLSPAMRPKVKRMWHSSFEPQLTKTGRTWYIFTPWHKDDLSHELVSKERYITFMSCVGPNMEAVWPEGLDSEELADRREAMGDIEFGRAYWLEAANEQGSPIYGDWIEYFDTSSVSLDSVVFGLSVDLAVGKSTGDFFAITWFAVDKIKQIIYVLGYYKGRIPYPEQREVVRRWSKLRRPNWIVIETVAYQEVFADEVKSDPEMGEFRSAVCKFKPRVSKRARLEAVSPWVKNGHIKFARILSNPGGAKPDLVRQIVDFGIEPNDDLADTVTQFALYMHDKHGFWKPKTGGVTVRAVGRRRGRRRRLT